MVLHEHDRCNVSQMMGIFSLAFALFFGSGRKSFSTLHGSFVSSGMLGGVLGWIRVWQMDPFPCHVFPGIAIPFSSPLGIAFYMALRIEREMHGHEGREEGRGGEG